MSSILPFPPRNTGRVRRSRSLDSMGHCRLSMMERHGESIPDNVVDLRSARPAPLIDDGRLALLLSLTLFAGVSAKRKKSIRNVVSGFARHDDGGRGDECRALLPLISERKPSC